MVHPSQLAGLFDAENGLVEHSCLELHKVPKFKMQMPPLLSVDVAVAASINRYYIMTIL